MDTSITINWTKATDTAGAQISANYFVYYSLSNNIDTLANILENGTLVNTGGTSDIATFQVTGLTSGTTYYFNVIAEDVYANQAAYSVAAQVTANVEGPVPGDSGTLSFINTVGDTITVNWTKATDTVDAQSSLKYYVYYSTSDNISTPETAAANGTLVNSGGTVDINSLQVTGLTAGTTYYFNVIAEDTDSNMTAYTAAAVTTYTETPVEGNSGTITFTKILNYSVTVNWTKATDFQDAQSSLIYYVFYSSSDNISTPSTAAANGTLVNSGGTADIDTLEVSALTPAGQSYYFNVVVEDTDVNQTAYTAATVTTTNDTTEAVPGNSGTLSFTNITSSSVTVNWTKATDDTVDQSLLDYYVYYSDTNNIDTVVNATMNGTLANMGETTDIDTYLVSGLSSGTTYYFNVVVDDLNMHQTAYTMTSQATN